MRHPNNIFTNQLLAKEAVWVYARALLLKPITTYANNTYVWLANTYANNSARVKMLQEKKEK